MGGRDDLQGLSDRELLDRWTTGDKRAGSVLINRHYKAVFRFFRNKCADWAEDLAQKTFTHCVKQPGKFRGESKFLVYLLGIARYVFLRELRDRSRRPDLDFNTLSSYDLGLDASGIMVQHAEQRLLLQALRSLSLEDQMLLEMYQWEGLTAPELSQVLEISVSAIRGRLRRAKDRLKVQVLRLVKHPELRESISGGFERWVHSIKAVIDGEQGEPN